MGGEKMEIMLDVWTYQGSPPPGGEKMNENMVYGGRQGSPPHGRGKECRIFMDYLDEGITPAWAGKRPPSGRGGTTIRDHPRVGGEKVTGLAAPTIEPGSPPHGRGKAEPVRTRIRGDRITPAWAGKRQHRRQQRARPQDHPRVGGEKTTSTATTCPPSGLPPRGQGKEAKRIGIIG